MCRPEGWRRQSFWSEARGHHTFLLGPWGAGIPTANSALMESPCPHETFPLPVACSPSAYASASTPCLPPPLCLCLFSASGPPEGWEPPTDPKTDWSATRLTPGWPFSKTFPLPVFRMFLYRFPKAINRTLPYSKHNEI